jgi:hypothetical protein
MNNEELDSVAETIDEHGSWGKIYESVFERSLVGAGAVVFAVWSYCIAKAKPPNGTCELNPILIGAILGETTENVSEAIEKLCSPDARTHTNGADGRRLEHVGAYTYRMVNWKIYRGPKSPEALREYYRVKQAQYRARKRAVRSVRI